MTREDLYRKFPPQWGEERTPEGMDAYQAYLDEKCETYDGLMMAFERCPEWMKEVAARDRSQEMF